ncbi:MAG: hypothetical protein HKN12_07345, partial [Gemmatimonadetes bacterium]|nr:hypothetical protein [Gemmatimonadota bacterium]
MTRGLLLLVAAGLLFRLLTFWLISPTPPIGDEVEYSFRGISLAAGEIVPGDGKRPPGSIWFYGAVHRLFGAEVAVARLANLFVSTLTLPLVWILGGRLGGPRTAWIATAAAAVYPGLLLYAPSLWSEALYNALSLGALVLLVPREGVPGPRAALA